MKYSLTLFQPREKTASTVSMSWALLMGLLMIWRMRSVAASGARVNPPPGLQLFEAIHQVDGEGLDAQGGQGDGELAAGEALGDGLDQFFNVRVVRGGQGEQRQFLRNRCVPGRLRRRARISSTGRSRTGRVIMPA